MACCTLRQQHRTAAVMLASLQMLARRCTSLQGSADITCHACCRRRCWLAQLNIEDSGVGFANFAWGSKSPPQQDATPRYLFLPPSSPASFLHIRLEGMGPKLLVSDVSTADQPVLRWRLVVRGNTAVEFGVVPLCLVVSVACRFA